MSPVIERLAELRSHLDHLAKLAPRVPGAEAWLVDPVLETLEVFRRHEEAWLLVLTASGDDVVRAEPFDALELLLTGLWIRPA